MNYHVVRFVGKTSQLVAVGLHVIEVQSGRYNKRRRKKEEEEGGGGERERKKKRTTTNIMIITQFNNIKNLVWSSIKNN